MLRGGDRVKTEAEMERRSHRQKHLDLQKPEAQAGFLPRRGEWGRGMALPTPRFQTYGFQNCEQTKVCRFKPPHLLSFAKAALGAKTIGVAPQWLSG